MAVVDFINPKTKKKDSFYMESKLLKNLKDIKKKLNDDDEDYVLCVDGREGSGKSVLGMQIAQAIDPTLSLERICMNAGQFKQAIYNAKKGQAVIFDEAFSGLSSRSSMSEVNRMLVSLMMQMRQKNLFVVVVLPTFFMLDKYVAIFRSRGLIHVHKVRGKRYFMVFNHKKKKLVYLTGKQLFTFGKIRTRFTGRFYGKYVIDEDEYRKKKAKALVEMEKEPEKNKIQVHRNKLIAIFKRETKYTTKKIEELFEKEDIGLKESAINTIIRQTPLNTAK